MALCVSSRALDQPCEHDALRRPEAAVTQVECREAVLSQLLDRHLITSVQASERKDQEHTLAKLAA